MTQLFSKQDYKKFLRGYTIYDCALNNSRSFTLVLVEAAPHRDTCPAPAF